MKAIFYAAGPDIRAGVTVKPFENVDVYPLIARILGLKTGTIDGRLRIPCSRFWQSIPRTDGIDTSAWEIRRILLTFHACPT